MELEQSTVTVTKLTLKFDTEEDARNFLVDPSPAQQLVRDALGIVNQIRNPQGRSKNGGKALRMGKQVRHPKAKAASARLRESDGTCPECGKSFKNLKLHRRKKHGVTDFASAATD